MTSKIHRIYKNQNGSMTISLPKAWTEGLGNSEFVKMTKDESNKNIILVEILKVGGI